VRYYFSDPFEFSCAADGNAAHWRRWRFFGLAPCATGDALLGWPHSVSGARENQGHDASNTPVAQTYVSTLRPRAAEILVLLALRVTHIVGTPRAPIYQHAGGPETLVLQASQNPQKRVPSNGRTRARARAR
jgi:hypothetical protein